jgi:hypothetical protein
MCGHWRYARIGHRGTNMTLTPDSHRLALITHPLHLLSHSRPPAIPTGHGQPLAQLEPARDRARAASLEGSVPICTTLAVSAFNSGGSANFGLG